MDAVISLKDLGLIVLWGSIVIMVIYLTLLFKRLNDTVKSVNRLIEDNREDIGNTMKEVPGITRNINDITTDANSGVQAMKGIVKNVGILKKAAVPAAKYTKRKKEDKSTK